jgi:pimeloyl-ACP methyl ester carboxylesterase
MWTLLNVLFWLGVAAGLLALYALIVGRLLRVDAQPDALHFTTTSDSWRLALARFRPGHALAGAPPLLLCPGLALTGRLFDLGADRSLARFLAQHGYDVWVLDWRGRGESERPRLGGRRRYTWCFDDYVTFDLPAALEKVAAESGAARVLGVGFGAGGLALLCGAGATATTARLAGVAALGCSAFYRRTSSALPGWWLRLGGRLRVEALTRLFAPLLGRFFPGPLGALQNRDSLEPAWYRRALVNAAASPSRREMQQLEDWLRRDLCTGLTDERDYRRLLAQVSAPVLLLAGLRDPLAPPDSIEQTSAALPGAPRQVVQGSRMHGMASNYGHLDLVLGANAARDTWPHLLRWLDEQSGVEVPSGRPEPPRGEVPMPPPAPRPGRITASGELQHPAAAAAAVPAQPAPAPAPPAPSPAAAAELFAAEQAETDAEEDQEDWLAGDVPRVPHHDDK